MRDILFKAKRVDNGGWINGDLIVTPFIRNETQENIPYILDITKADYDCFGDLDEDNGIFEVDPETICEYTGMTDKNGKRIWENDIVQFDFRQSNWGYRGKILFEDGEYRYRMFTNAKDLFNCRICGITKNMEVIGNIFDNPELIKRIK